MYINEQAAPMVLLRRSLFLKCTDLQFLLKKTELKTQEERCSVDVSLVNWPSQGKLLYHSSCLNLTINSSKKRCLGDPDFKIPTSEANFVSSEPFVNAIPIAEEYKFILLACDGLFDKVEPQHAIEFLHHKLQETGDVNTACNALAELALERGSNDNVTIVLTKFNW